MIPPWTKCQAIVLNIVTLSFIYSFNLISAACLSTSTAQPEGTQAPISIMKRSRGKSHMKQRIVRKPSAIIIPEEMPQWDPGNDEIQEAVVQEETNEEEHQQQTCTWDPQQDSDSDQGAPLPSAPASISRQNMAGEEHLKACQWKYFDTSIHGLQQCSCLLPYFDTWHIWTSTLSITNVGESIVADLYLISIWHDAHGNSPCYFLMIF